MGRDFCTVDEAAAILKRSVRSVHSYVRKGALRKTSEGGRSVLVRADVERLSDSLSNSKPPPTPSELWDLMAKVRRMEMDLTVLKRMLGVDLDPLRPEPAQCLALYGAAKAAKLASPWKPQEVRLWAGVFPRIDESVLKSVAEASGNRDPWEPFFSLCLEMIRFCAAQENYEQSIEWQEIHKLLLSAKDRLRSAILGWEGVSSGTFQAPSPSRITRLSNALS